MGLRRLCWGVLFGGDPQDLGNFFGSVMTVSARCNFRWTQAFSASSCFTRESIRLRRRPALARAPAGERAFLPPPVRQV